MPSFKPLTVFCYVDKDTKYDDLEALDDELNRLYPVKLIIQEFDGDDAEWVQRKRRDGTMGSYLSDEYNGRMCQDVFDKYGNKVDLVGIFIAPKNWKNTKEARLLGTQFGKRHNDYYVFSCKLYSRYEGTGEHEILHAMDNFIQFYGGIKLETVFKVKDFDKHVVHNRNYWKKGYFYDEVWQKMAPILSFAIGKKRKKAPVVNRVSIANVINEVRLKNSESITEGWKYFSMDEKTGMMGTIADLEPKLVDALDKARGIAGVPFKITSGYRTPAHNAKVGGAKNSEHLYRWAADIACPDSKTRYKIITALLEAGFTRIGIGQNFVHAGLSPDHTPEVIWHYYK